VFADLATGTGRFGAALQRIADAKIAGVDFLPEMLELAKQKGLRQPVLADAMNLPFGDGSLIVSRSVWFAQFGKLRSRAS